MSWVRVKARKCELCGHDSARIVGDWLRGPCAVQCGNDDCGALGSAGLSDVEAVFAWNAMPHLRNGDLLAGLVA